MSHVCAYSGPRDLSPVRIVETSCREEGEGVMDVSPFITQQYGFSSMKFQIKFKIYRDHRKEWRWRMYSRNGKTLGDSGEGYKRRSHIKRMIEKIIMGPHEVEE